MEAICAKDMCPKGGRRCLSGGGPALFLRCKEEAKEVNSGQKHGVLALPNT